MYRNIKVSSLPRDEISQITRVVLKKQWVRFWVDLDDSNTVVNSSLERGSAIERAYANLAIAHKNTHKGVENV